MFFFPLLVFIILVYTNTIIPVTGFRCRRRDLFVPILYYASACNGRRSGCYLQLCNLLDTAVMKRNEDIRFYKKISTAAGGYEEWRVEPDLYLWWPGAFEFKIAD